MTYPEKVIRFPTRLWEMSYKNSLQATELSHKIRLRCKVIFDSISGLSNGST